MRSPLTLLFHRPLGTPRSYPMAAVSLTVDRVDHLPTGATVVMWSDSTSKEFATLTALQEYGAPEDTYELIRKASIDHWLARSPTAADDNQVEGKTFKYDPAQDGSVVGVI